jgi:hypothetical protein
LSRKAPRSPRSWYGSIRQAIQKRHGTRCTLSRLSAARAGRREALPTSRPPRHGHCVESREKSHASPFVENSPMSATPDRTECSPGLAAIGNGFPDHGPNGATPPWRAARIRLRRELQPGHPLAKCNDSQHLPCRERELAPTFPR